MLYLLFVVCILCGVCNTTAYAEDDNYLSDQLSPISKILNKEQKDGKNNEILQSNNNKKINPFDINNTLLNKKSVEDSVNKDIEDEEKILY